MYDTDKYNIGDKVRFIDPFFIRRLENGEIVRIRRTLFGGAVYMIVKSYFGSDFEWVKEKNIINKINK